MQLKPIKIFFFFPFSTNFLRICSCLHIIHKQNGLLIQKVNITASQKSSKLNDDRQEEIVQVTKPRSVTPTLNITTAEKSMAKKLPSPLMVTKIGSANRDNLNLTRDSTIRTSREFLNKLLESNVADVEPIPQLLEINSMPNFSQSSKVDTYLDEELNQFEPYHRRDSGTKDGYQSTEELELYNEPKLKTNEDKNKPRNTGAIPKGTVTPVFSETERSSSSLSHNRKSVSFDLPDPEPGAKFIPTFDSDDDSDDDVVMSSDASQPSEKPPVSVMSYEQNTIKQTAAKPIKGILRCTSPSLSQTSLERQYPPGSIASWIKTSQEQLAARKNDEIEHDNPFKKEFESKEVDTIVHAYPVKVRPQTTYEPLEEPLSLVPKKPIYASTGNISTDRAKPKPPLPPKPQKLKQAALVRNEGLDIMRQGLEKGDYVEYEHDPITNTVKEVKSDRDSFSPDTPLPPLPPVQSNKSRIPQLNLMQRSVGIIERPKQSPPPPPTPKTPIVVDADVIEILPAKYETLPKVEQAKVVHENSKENILVSDAMHCQILLQENELRNALRDRELFTPADPNSNQDTMSTTASQHSSTSGVFSPDSTMSRTKIPVLQSTSVFPPPQMLPVHYTQLPTPQQPGLIQTVPRDHHIQLCQPINTGSASSHNPNKTIMLVSSNPQSFFTTSTAAPTAVDNFMQATTHMQLQKQAQYYHQPLSAMHEQHVLHQWNRDNTFTTSNSTTNSSSINPNNYMSNNLTINTSQATGNSVTSRNHGREDVVIVGDNVNYQSLSTAPTNTPTINPVYVTNTLNNPNWQFDMQNGNQVIYVQTQFVPAPGTVFVEQIESSGTSRSSSVSTITSLPPNLPISDPQLASINVSNAAIGRTSFIDEPSPTMTTFGKQTQV